MNRVFVSFPITDFKKIKQQVLYWLSSYHIASFLDNNQYSGAFNSQECIAAAGSYASIQASAGNAFGALKLFSRDHNDWLFGHCSFELKNETEGVVSALPDPIGFADLFFFVPEILVLINPERISIGLLSQDHDAVYQSIRAANTRPLASPDSISPIQSSYTRDEYVRIVGQLRAHILRGDCYEINFCQEFHAARAFLDPLALFERLNALSPAPYAAYYRNGDRFLVCASPERYLKKQDDTLTSQPMKGTGPRNLADHQADTAHRERLGQSEKDRAENVMVVDLVRNDLSKIAEKDSVQVEELFSVQRFPQVHQMVSTVHARARKGMDWTDMLAATFPMGSMTGAPKKRVLELIDRYEKSKRGIFSGTVGYVTPARDFDFNVVIRSLLYNQANHCLSYFAGSGITFASDADQEYEECMLKAAAMEAVIKKP